MEGASQITEFGKILIFLIMGILFVCFTFLMGRLVALRRPGFIKNSSYECGEEAVGSSWIQFNSRFYVIALVFLLFDVEMVFIFPWATVFGQEVLIQADSRWGWLSLGEMFIFVGVLLLGLLYVWKKGDLNWIKPAYIKPVVNSNIPASAYEAINTSNYKLREFQIELIDSDVKSSPTQAIANPGFRPLSGLKFKKTSE